jgi:CheY-like chemotaxis protein
MPMGGEIEVTCENFVHDQAHLLPVEPRRYVKLTIKDHGTGIPIDHIDRIFDPYFTTKQEGSGLGLAVTHSIIVKHKGHIEVKSKDGNETIFTIYLPASSLEHETTPVEDEDKQWNCTGKILFMDDEEMIRDITRNMLSHAGYEVVLAASGEEAVALFKKANDTASPFDAVILDLTIPGGMGGKETAEIIHKISPDTHLIVSSGYSNDPIMANYRDYGFCSAITKPYLFKELMETIQKVLS